MLPSAVRARKRVHARAQGLHTRPSACARLHAPVHRVRTGDCPRPCPRVRARAHVRARQPTSGAPDAAGARARVLAPVTLRAPVICTREHAVRARDRARACPRARARLRALARLPVRARPSARARICSVTYTVQVRLRYTRILNRIQKKFTAKLLNGNILTAFSAQKLIQSTTIQFLRV